MPPFGRQEPPADAMKAWRAEALQYDLEGLRLLCEHYGIDETDPVVRYMTLAHRLAHEVVPYFQATGRQRGKKVDRVNGLNLALDVADIKRRRNRTVRTDARALTELAERTSGCRRHEDLETLRKRLQRARTDPIVAFCLRVADRLPAYRLGTGRKELLDFARGVGRII